MQETVVCPECKRRLVLPSGSADIVAQCPSCKTQFTPPSAPPVVHWPNESHSPEPEAFPASDPHESASPYHDYSKPVSQKTPGKSGGGTAAWIVAVVLIAIGRWIFSGGAARQNGPNPYQDNDRFQNPNGLSKEQRDVLLKSLQATRAIRLDGHRLPIDNVEEFGPLFADLERAFRQADGDRLMTHFDVDRMLGEFSALKILPEMAPDAWQEFLRTANRGMPRELELHARSMAWSRVVIQHGNRLPVGEATIVAEHTTLDGKTRKIRWWLVRRLETWKVYDMEDLETGTRLSVNAGVSLARAKDLQPALAKLDEAFHAILVEKDINTADRKLTEMGEVKLPSLLAARRLMALGLIRLRRGQAKEALEAFRQARAAYPDLPALTELEGVASKELGR